MKWEEIRKIIESTIKDCGMQYSWKRIEVSSGYCHTYTTITPYLLGETPDGRQFVVEIRMYRKNLENNKDDAVRALVDCTTRNALCTLDTFMDSRCQCVPSKSGQMIGEHCKFHKGIYGY